MYNVLLNTCKRAMLAINGNYMYTAVTNTVEDIKKLMFRNRSTIVLWFVPFLQFRIVFTIIIVFKND